MCISRGGAFLSMMSISIEEHNTVPLGAHDKNSIEPVVVIQVNHKARGIEKLDSTSSTQPCSEEFCISEAESSSPQFGRHGPSAILGKVREGLAWRKSDTSVLDTSRNGRKLDFLEGLEDVDCSDSCSDGQEEKNNDVSSPTNDTEPQEGRSSLMLRVRGKLARRKSDTSVLDTSHNGRKLDFLEGLEEDADGSDSCSDNGEEPDDASSPTNGATNVDVQQEEGRSSLILRVRGKLARRKSDTSVLDTCHNGRKLDFLEGLQDEVDGSDSLTDEEEKLDDDSSPKVSVIDTQQEECHHAPSLEKPSLHRIVSTPAIMQNTSPSGRRPSCLRNSSFNSLSVKSTSSNASSVHFGTINIREYQRALVDNPAVTDGPPIGLGWDYDPHECNFDVDEYEDLRPTPRKREEFCIPPRVREEMLVHEWGHTLHDVRRASQEAKEIRLLRERTQKMSKQSEQVSELVDSTMRNWHRLKTKIIKG